MGDRNRRSGSPEASLRRGLTCARLVWGALLVGVPEPLARAFGPADGRQHTAVCALLRVLGARHLAQAAAFACAPTSGVLATGAAADALHALTAAGAALGSDRWRRGALLDTGVAASFAAATLGILLLRGQARRGADQRCSPVSSPVSSSSSTSTGSRQRRLRGGPAACCRA